MSVAAPPRPTVRRHVLAAAGAPAVVSYLAALAVLAVVVATAPGAEGTVAGTARAGAVAWLAVHQVPLVVSGAPLGVLPLLPTLAFGLLTALAAAGVARRAGLHRPDDAALVAGAIGALHAALGAALAFGATPAAVTADPVQAALGCGLLAAGAAACGLAGPCGVGGLARRQLPGWARRGLGAGALSLGVLLTGGATVVLVALVVSRDAVRDLVGAWGPGAGAMAGVTVLSVAYLPDAAVAGVAWLCGPGFTLGAGPVGPLHVEPGEVPALPLVAALPGGAATGWWAASAVVPLAAGVLAGRRCRLLRPVDRCLAVLVAGGVAAAGVAAAALVVGGRLGTGAVDPVDLRPGPLALAVFLVTAVPAAVVGVLPAPAGAGRRGRVRAGRTGAATVPDGSPDGVAGGVPDGIADGVADGSLHGVVDGVPDEGGPNEGGPDEGGPDEGGPVDPAPGAAEPGSAAGAVVGAAAGGVRPAVGAPAGTGGGAGPAAVAGPGGGVAAEPDTETDTDPSLEASAGTQRGHAT